jgi:hypothetical protein
MEVWTVSYRQPITAYVFMGLDWLVDVNIVLHQSDQNDWAEHFSRILNEAIQS